ncbi:hypothetical protein X975_24007, partial [Stegodyphus mimosarum]
MMGRRVKSDVCRILICRSWFVSFDLGPETCMVSYICHFPVNALVISVAIASMNSTMAISCLFVVVRTMFSFGFIPEVIRFWLVGLIVFLVITCKSYRQQS